jgi:hypothetical protein
MWLLAILVGVMLLPGRAQAQNVTDNTDPANYYDNRTTPITLMTSFVNALNRHEYLRAYSYWEITATTKPDQLQDFPTFEQGYQQTQRVILQIGTVTGDPGAGNIYYAVPVIFQSQLTSGTTQTFVGCYVLHGINDPSVVDFVPYPPMSIQSANVAQIASGANPNDLLAQTCRQYGGGSIYTDPTPASDPNRIDSSVYLDDRSDPAAVLRSMFNAINLHQYARAYSYWEITSSTKPADLPTYDAFKSGYAATQSVQLATGTITSDAGAGQFHYSVPVTLRSALTTGAQQIFVGCYYLHLSSPTAQAVPPFAPLAISSANIVQVANNANTDALMQTACH